MVLLVLLMVSLPAAQYGKIKPLYLYYNFSYGTRSLSLCNAFTAAADDLSAVWHNPAGLAKLKMPEFYFSYRTGKLRFDHNDDAGSLPGEYNYEFSSTLKNLDFLSIAVPVFFWDIKWNLALSYYRYIPYGFNGGGLGSLGADPAAGTEFSVKGTSGIDVLAFTGALDLTEYLSFGITFQRFINAGDIVYDWATPTASYSQSYSEKIDGWNIVLGLSLELHPDFILAVSYHGKLSGTLDVQYDYQDPSLPPLPDPAETQTDVIIPARFAVGLAVRPFRFVRLTFDYSVIQWKKAVIKDYFGQAGLQFPVKNDFTFSQENNVNFRMGAEFNIPIKKNKTILFIRTGWCSEKQLFAGASGSAVRVKGFSLGAGVDFLSVLKIDLAYMHQNAGWKETAYFDSQYTVDAGLGNNIFSLSLTYGFGGRN
jgi:hypothetical protein